MFEFSKTPLIMLLVAVVGVALFWWPGFLTAEKAEYGARVANLKHLLSPRNEIDSKGRWVRGTPDAYPFKTTLKNGDGSEIRVEIKGRSSNMVRFTKNDETKVFDYPINRLSEGSRNAVLSLPANLDIGPPGSPKDRIVAGIEGEIKRIEEKIEGLSAEAKNAENKSTLKRINSDIERRKSDIKRLEARIRDRE